MARVGFSSSGSRRGLAAAIGLGLGLLTVLVSRVVMQVERGTPFEGEGELGDEDEDLRQAAIRGLVNLASGLWDSFPDPDVGRVMMPDVEGKPLHGVVVKTNSHGMRERAYQLPKPAGVVRVVILGDSYVMGYGVSYEELLGQHLESFLGERSDRSDLRIECLHLGMGSWNIIAECAYLRRQLSLMKPDLVVQVTVPNDLNDCLGVRGFGEWASFSPRVGHRTTGILTHSNPRGLGFAIDNWLSWGLDHESRERFAEAAQAIRRLRDAVRAQGGRYLHLMRWSEQLPVAELHLGAFLDDAEKVYLSPEFDVDPEYTLSRYDPHWNAAGNRAVAELVYARIQGQGLLPGLGLGPWEQASRREREIDTPARALARGAVDITPQLELTPIRPVITFGRLTQAMAGQIYGGLERDGRAAPFASLMLASEGTRRIQISGGCPAREELRGTRVRVSVEEVELTEIELEPGRPFVLDMPLPEAVLDRPYLTVRFESSDYAYDTENMRRCISFILQRIAVTP